MTSTETAGGADLHAHSNRSDGILSPADLVRAAADAGLQAIALTDHDTVAGIAAAREAARAWPVAFVAGIEVSCRVRNREAHVLGLFIDETAPEIRSFAKTGLESRLRRATRMVDRARKLGLELSMAGIEEVAGDAAIGRPHVAAALVASGAVASTELAFHNYLGIGRPLAVPKDLSAAAAVIAMIHRAGGVAVVAHPGSSRVRDRLLAELANDGLDGVEILHPTHGRQRQDRLLELSRRLGLLPSGGSDFHGSGRGTALIGDYRAPIEWYENLRQCARTRRTTRGHNGESL